MDTKQVPVSKDEKKQEYLDSKRSKTRLRRTLFVAAVGVIVSVVVVSVIVLVFFRVENIEVVKASSYYPDEVIVSQTGIENGKCIFLYRTGKIAVKLTEDLPYIASVTIRRSPPSTIRIYVTDDAPAYVYTFSGSYVLTDASDKVLEYPCASVPDGVVMVTGVELARTPVPGRYLMAMPEGETLAKEAQSAENARLSSLELKNKIAAKCAEYGLAPLTGVDLTDIYGVKAVIDGRFTLKLGTCSDLDYELKLAYQVILKDDQEHPGESLLIDLTMDRKAVLRRADSDDGTVTYSYEESTAATE